MSPSRALRYGLFLLPLGQHPAAWRLPTALQPRSTDLKYLAGLARSAEQAGFDFLFLADVDATLQTESGALSRDPASEQLDPVTLLAALAATTAHIGLVASVSTEYNMPYHVARRMASLDHLSGGRAGWNVVTSAWPQAAANFGQTSARDHADRYARAEDFLAAVTALWDGWSEGAVIADQVSGVYFDPARVRAPDYVGRFFQTKGPLNVSRPPQGHPVIVQAGSSEPGRALAARSAEIVFTAQSDMAAAAAFRADLHARLVGEGRLPSDLLVMPGLVPVIAETRAAAQAKLDALAAFTDPAVARATLEAFLDVDLSALDLDDRFPLLPISGMHSSRQALVNRKAQDEALTLRQVHAWFAVARGHLCVIGTPADLADEIARWQDAGAADGFNIMLPVLPDDLDAFATLAVPALRARGLMDAPPTAPCQLRDRLGLPRPVGRP